jgi:hypothetical protein
MASRTDGFRKAFALRGMQTPQGICATHTVIRQPYSHYCSGVLHLDRGANSGRAVFRVDGGGKVETGGGRVRQRHDIRL